MKLRRNLFSFFRNLSIDFENRPILPPDFANRIRSNSEIADCEFNLVLPAKYRVLAPIHWTPLSVVKLIADALGNISGARFIDVGSGTGKVCVSLSYLTDWQIFGLEQRQQLIEIAKSIVEVNRIDRVKLIEGNLNDLDWNSYDIFYFFNPFQEHLFCSDPLLIDNSIELDPSFYPEYVNFVESRLRTLQSGKILITFDGFGGDISSDWKLQLHAEIDSGLLKIWEKA